VIVDCLIDTNILLRSVDANSAQHEEAVQAVVKLRLQGKTLWITAQTAIEFWAVVTRPVAANGLGWDLEKGAQGNGGYPTTFSTVV
jgi:predicted nucleic acid-binding protein